MGRGEQEKRSLKKRVRCKSHPVRYLRENRTRKEYFEKRSKVQVASSKVPWGEENKKRILRKKSKVQVASSEVN